MAQSVIINATTFDEAMIHFDQSLPCVLHMENYSLEIVIEHLLRAGKKLCEGNKTTMEKLRNDKSFALQFTLILSIK